MAVINHEYITKFDTFQRIAIVDGEVCFLIVKVSKRLRDG